MRHNSFLQIHRLSAVCASDKMLLILLLVLDDGAQTNCADAHRSHLSVDGARITTEMIIIDS